MRALSRFRLAAVACALAFALPALAAEAPKKASKPAPQKPNVVCTYETPTGSHFPKKICTTQEHRTERRNADQEAMRNTQNNRGAPVQPMTGR